MASTTDRAGGVGLRSERGPILIAMMMSMALIALDSTIIATAVPSIVRQLGGFAQFPWLFSIYLLTQAVTVPLYGKFSDVIGRKPILFLGIGLFLLGSVLGGFAWSMPSLIVARGIQGLGAGAIQPTVVTVIGDLYSIEERAKVQGYLASVWGVSSVVGPTLGGLFAQYLSWRWIFFINLPLGALAFWLLRTRFVEEIKRREHSVDYLGAGLLATGCSLLILALLEGGVAWKWASPTGVGVVVLGFVLMGWFVRVERRVTEPTVPLWVFSRRILIVTSIGAAGAGAILIGLTSYVPTYAQGVLGATPVVAGLALAAMMLGWPLSSSNSGRLYLRIGFRNTALIGSVLVVVGTVLAVVLLTDSAPIWHVGVACFVIGAGLGLSVTPLIVAIQSVVGWERRGVVTGANMFSRSIGSAVGVAVFGAIANATIAHRFAHPPPGLGGHLPTNVDETSQVIGAAHPNSAVTAFVRAALYQATHNVLIAIAIVALIMSLAVWSLPRKTEMLEFEESAFISD
jgi:EmrB/QacA subfamily drug resistance transporter